MRPTAFDVRCRPNPLIIVLWTLILTACTTADTTTTPDDDDPTPTPQLVPIIDTGPGSSVISGASVALNGRLGSLCTPQPNCGLSYQWLAAQFTLTSGVTLEAVEGWMRVSLVGDINVVIRSDSAGVPSTAVFSKKYTPLEQFTLDWLRFDAFRPTLATGTYWLSFEPGDGFSGSISWNVPRPLAQYLFTNNTGRWMTVTDGNFVPRSLGVKLLVLPSP